MKPFNLEAARAGAPVITRDGRKVRVLCFDFKVLSSMRIVALVSCTSELGDFEELITTDSSGVYSDLLHCNCDLFMATAKKERWINIYRNASGLFPGYLLFDTEAEAIAGIETTRYIEATVKIQWDA